MTNEIPCGDLHRYLDEELDAPARERFEKHLGTCDRCPGELAALHDLGRSLGELPPPPPPEGLARDLVRGVFAELDGARAASRPGPTGRPPLVHAWRTSFLLGLGLVIGGVFLYFPEELILLSQGYDPRVYRNFDREARIQAILDPANAALDQGRFREVRAMLDQVRSAVRGAYPRQLVASMTPPGHLSGREKQDWIYRLSVPEGLDNEESRRWFALKNTLARCEEIPIEFQLLDSLETEEDLDRIRTELKASEAPPNDPRSTYVRLRKTHQEHIAWTNEWTSLRLRLAQVLENLGRHGEAREILGEVEQVARELDPTSFEGRIFGSPRDETRAQDPLLSLGRLWRLWGEAERGWKLELESLERLRRNSPEKLESQSFVAHILTWEIPRECPQLTGRLADFLHELEQDLQGWIRKNETVLGIATPGGPLMERTSVRLERLRANLQELRGLREKLSPGLSRREVER